MTVPIRLADGEVARLLHVGERVDVLAARSEDPAPARVIASAVPIITVPTPPDDADEGALIMIQTTHTQATALARAAVDSRLSVTILPP